MKVTGPLRSVVTRILIESFDMKGLGLITSHLFRNYNFNERSGFSDNLSVPKQVAARQLVADISQSGLFIKMMQVLVDLHTNGHMGRRYVIKDLGVILKHMREQGIVYDLENKIFVEDPAKRRTKNWGTLYEGEEYMFALLRVDIVGNSKLVREYPDEVIQQTYNDFRGIVQDAIDRRNGRIWSWEGDGGLVSFFFSNKKLFATYAGMEIVNNLFLYNKMRCPLNQPLQVRTAVHNGIMEYTSSEEDLKQADPVKKVMNIEANYTPPNTLTVSDTTINVFCRELLSHFDPIVASANQTFYNYSLKWEEPQPVED